MIDDAGGDIVADEMEKEDNNKDESDDVRCDNEDVKIGSESVTMATEGLSTGVLNIVEGWIGWVVSDRG